MAQMMLKFWMTAFYLLPIPMVPACIAIGLSDPQLTMLAFVPAVAAPASLMFAGHLADRLPDNDVAWFDR